MKYLKLVFCFFLSWIAISQNDNISYPLKTITVNDGLSANSIFGIQQDSIGYIWFATPNGLNKFDGREFEYFPKNFVSEGDIIMYDKKIYKDKRGALWIITGERDLEKYDVFSSSFIKSSAFPLPKTLFQDSELNMYIGTSDNGIFKINYKTKDTIQILDRFDIPKHVNAFTEYNGAVWASSTSGIIRINNDNTYSILKLPILNSLDITSIVANSENGLFVGTYMNGLFKLNSEEQEFNSFLEFNDEHIPKDIYIHNLYFDSKERLWIGSYGNGLYMVDFTNSNLHHLVPERNNPYSLQYNCISSIYEDNNQTIWFGTDGGGVSYLDEELIKFKRLTYDEVSDDINLNMVKALALDEDQDIWIATHNYGLIKLSKDLRNIKAITTENSSLSSNKIAYIEYINDELWIANESPEIQILHSDGSFTTFNKASDPKLDVGYIYEIFQDSKNKIWLTTSDKGLIRFDKDLGMVQQYNYEPEKSNSISSNLVFSIAEGQDNLLWVGTKYKGLCSINTITNEIQRFPQIPGMIRSIHIDSQNNIWVGTNTDGLIFFNPETEFLKKFTTKNGLAGNTIFSILPDNDNLWLGTNSGISKFNRITYEITNFSTEDGLQSSEFNDNAAIKDYKSNVLYFGGLKGINWFNPQDFTINNSKPKTTISKVEVMDQPIGIYENPVFEYDRNTIQFTFSSLHFSAPSKNEFKFKLLNYDNDWRSMTSTNTIRYTNLPPNQYKFEVLSSNYDGIWNTNPATYSFTILKPWYGTNLALAFYALLITIGIYVLTRYYKWRINIKNQLAFEHKEAKRLMQLDEFKNRLFTNISHEFRTPLTLIKGPVENQLNKSNLSDSDREELGLIKRSTRRLLNLVDQILDLSKLESGHLKLKVEKGDLGLLIRQFVEVFNFKARTKSIDFNSNLDINGIYWYDKEVVEKIITNLLSNAVKYTPEHGTIKLHASIKEGQLILSITNSGSNISQEHLNKVFDRYYQANKNSDGAGIGLSLVKELVLLSHGSILANKINDDEIQFSITLPVERNYYKASDICTDQERSSTDLNENERVKINNQEANSKTVDKPQILIVEDDADIRKYIKLLLKDKFKLIEADNGRSGIAMAIKSIPDLIISDIMMPIIDGIEVCNALKHDEKTSHIPIILLTAKADKAHEIEGLKIGADAYITKPFDKDKLLVQINNLIRIRKKLQERYTKNFKLKDVAITSIEQEFINRLKKVLDENITDNEFSVESFSRYLGMSRMQLHRKIKALTGTSASEFITNERLKLALNLLETTDRNISEIAYETGFNSASYFIKCFKKVYGHPPLKYQSDR